MSGGYFDYKNDYLKTEIFGWYDSPRNVFEDREISELVWDVFELIHVYDYYKTGDTSKETYLTKKREFKKKWFSNRGVRVRQIIDQAISELHRDLYETFNLEGDINTDV